VEDAAHDRGAHALAVGLRAGRLEDDLVGAHDGIAQDDRRARQAGFLVGVREVFALDGLAHEVHDGLHGDAAGHFAGVVAAHAVGQHHEAQVAIPGNGVLVVLAHAPGVGETDAAQLAFQAHRGAPVGCPVMM
jgi:hypothetical protein